MNNILTSVEWTKKKPKFDKECLLATAVKVGGFWDYSIFVIERVEIDGKWYYGWFNGAGEECGDLKDLKADKYCVLPLLK